MEPLYNEFQYPDLEDDIRDIIANDWDRDNYDEVPLEELYEIPSNKFIKLVNFELINDYYENNTNEESTVQQREEDIILQLLNHPYGDSATLDNAYRTIYLAIEQYEKQLLAECLFTAQESYHKQIDFQREERSESCPVCFEDTCFQDCQRFYKCQTCRGGVCADCAPLVGDKCPLCNVRVPLQPVCLNTITTQLQNTLPPKMSVRKLIYEKMYCSAGKTNKNVFGLPCEVRFNMENLTDVEFDYEIAEFLRHTQSFLSHKKHTMATPNYERELETKYWWSVGLVPLFKQ